MRVAKGVTGGDVNNDNVVMRRALVASLWLSAGLCAGAASAAAGQGDGPGTPQQAPQDAPSRLRGEDGQLDVSDFLAKPKAFLPVPVIVTEPAVGYGGGAIGMFLRPRENAGQEGWSRPDLSLLGGLVTQNGTWLGLAGDSSRWMDGRLRTLAGGGSGRINLDFYGVANAGAVLADKVRYSLQFTGALLQGNWQLDVGSPWSIGLRYVYANIDPHVRDEPVFPALIDGVRVTVSAPVAILEYDSRDNIFTPTRGIYAESAYLASRQSLGSTDDFERFDQVLMGWHPLARNVTLGARADYGWASVRAPFFLRPYVSLRGVPVVRYQGDRVASLELETRWQFFGRYSIVAFGGAATARTERDNASVVHNVGSAGVGVRYELASKFGLHVGVDVAHSPGTNAVYLQVGNAWFRP